MKRQVYRLPQVAEPREKHMTDKILAFLVAILVTTPVGARAQAPPIPSEYQGIYNELSRSLDEFESTIDASWDGVRGPVTLGATLMGADSHRGAGLLDPDTVQGTLLELDGLEALGVGAVTLRIHFPMLYEPFMGSPQTTEAFLNYYKSLVTEIRGRNMKVVVESQVMFSEAGLTPWPVGAYYAGLSLEEYKQGRAQVARTIATELAPDYLSVIMEPDTEADQSGKPEIGTIAGSTGLLTTILATLDTAGVEGTKVGAGIGAWLPDHEQFVQAFSSTTIDYFDMHLFHVSGGFVERAVEIAALARAYGKQTAMSQAWLPKVTEQEIYDSPGLEQLLARDAFSFWAPLDTRYLEAVTKFAFWQQMEFMAAFDSGSFRSYVDYSDATRLLDPVARRDLLRDAQRQAILAGQYTATGLGFMEAVVGSTDLVPPVAPSSLSTIVDFNPRIFLQWDPGSDNYGVSGYDLQRDGETVYSGAYRYYWDEDLDDGQTYEYSVSAFDAHGLRSAPSPVVAATTFDVTPPTEPVLTSAVVSSHTQVDLAWTVSEDNVGVSGYIVLRGLSGSNLRPIASVAEISYTDTGVFPGKSYTYAVQAVDVNALRSQISRSLEVSTPSDQDPPTVPAGLTAEALSDRSIELAWQESQDPSGVLGYKIFIGASQQALQLVTFTPATTWMSTSLPPATVYYLAVQSVDIYGNHSELSEAVSARTDDPADTSPPYVGIVVPTSGAYRSGQVVVAASAVDVRRTLYDAPSGVAGVQFQVDGVDVGPEDTVAPYIITIDTTVLTNGQHVLTAVARDNADHVATSNPVVLNVLN